MGATTEFFSLEDSPARSSAKPEEDVVLRDHYGFVVPPDYHDLYRIYSPEWEREECERESNWGCYLTELAHLNSDSGNFSDLRDLCNSYFPDEVTAARSGRGDASERQKLAALVQGGVPFSIRGHVWTVFLDTSLRKQRGYYNDLVRRCLGDLQHRGRLELDEIRQQAATAAAALQGAAALHGLSGYAAVTEAALATWRANSRVWLTQIEKDLPRTFPGLALMELSGRPALRRVLAAYSLHNSRVGYCQGLNFVVGTLLLFLDEEEAFWCCCALLDDILTGYYDVDMMAMQVDQRVFKELVGQHFPRLAAHLEGLGADVSSVFVQWFLCVFVNYLPLEACLRVWDALFYHRSTTVLFKTALALLSVFSPALEAAGDVLEALDLLHSLAPLSYDSGRLLAEALGPGLADVTDARLDELRAKHRREVEAEAAALAEELAWEASSSGAATGTSSLATQPQPASQPPTTAQPQGKISVLKMLARGVKEKFTGGGGGGGPGMYGSAGGGSGANSVERAASPAPDALQLGGGAAAAAATAGGAAATLAEAAVVPAGGAGGGSGSVVVGNNGRGGGGTDEPLLVRASHPLGGVDADSEDYHRLGGEDAFQYEQVGYVAPSDLSETASNAAVVFVGRPGEEDRSLGGAGALAAGVTGLPERSAAAAAAAAPAGGAKGAGGAAQQQRPEVTASVSATALTVADPLAALFDDGGGVGSGVPPAAERPVGPCYTWHETPRWQSVRAGGAATGGGFGCGAPAAAVAAAAPVAVATDAAAATSGTGSPLGALSPRAVILTAGRTQSQALMTVLPPGGSTAGDGDEEAAGDDPFLPQRRAQDGSGSVPGEAAGTSDAAAAAAPASLPPPAATPLVAAGGAAAAPAAASPDPSAGPAPSRAPCSGGEPGRRGPGGRRHCSRAAAMAWEIALAPLKHRTTGPPPPPPQQQQQLPPPGDAACRAPASEQVLQEERGREPVSGVPPPQQPGLPSGSGAAAAASAPEAACCGPRGAAAGEAGAAWGGGAGPGPAGPGPGPAGSPLEHGAAAAAPLGGDAGGGMAGVAAGLGGPLAAGAAPPRAAAAQAPAPGPVGMPAQDPGAGPARAAPSVTPAAAIPVAAPRAPHAHPPHPHPHHAHYYLQHPYANGGAFAGGGGGGVASPGGPALQHPPPGSSVASTGSMLIVDEHREASPAEARDEWVIMSVPGEGPAGVAAHGARHPAASIGAGPGPRPRQGSHGHSGLYSPPHGGPPRPHAVQPPPMGYRGFETPPHGAAAAAGGHDSRLSSYAPTAAGQRGGSINGAGCAGAGPGAGAAAGIGVGTGASAYGGADGSRNSRAPAPHERGSSPAGDDGASAVQELREQLGVEDLLLHHSALAARLRDLQAQQEERSAAAAAPGPAAAVAAAAAAGQPSEAPEEVDATGLAAALNRLSELEALHAALLARSRGDAGDGSGAAAAGAPPSTTTTTTTAGADGAASAGAIAPLLPAAVLPLPLLPDVPPPLFPEVLVAPGGQVVCAPLPPAAASAGGHGGSHLGRTPSLATLQQTQPQSPSQQPQTTMTMEPGEPGDLGEGARAALRAAAGLCSSVRGDLEHSRACCGEGLALLQQYAVLAEVLSSRLEEVVRQLAEQQYTSDKLSSKLASLMQLYAAQDAALADQEHAYQQQQHPQPHPQPPRAAGVVGGVGPVGGLSSALGFGGGGGMSPLQSMTFHGAGGRAGGAGAHSGGGGSSGTGPGGAQARYSSPQRGTGLWQNLRAKITGGKDDREYPLSRG